MRSELHGNIIFIGELFKVNMLTEKNMHDCIFRLLKANNSDSLLLLCILISTVGSYLDKDEVKLTHTAPETQKMLGLVFLTTAPPIASYGQIKCAAQLTRGQLW